MHRRSRRATRSMARVRQRPNPPTPRGKALPFYLTGTAGGSRSMPELRQLIRGPHRDHGPDPGALPLLDAPGRPHDREGPGSFRQLEVPGRVIRDQPLPGGSVQGRPQGGEQPPRRRRQHPFLEQLPERPFHVPDVQLSEQDAIQQPAGGSAAGCGSGTSVGCCPAAAPASRPMPPASHHRTGGTAEFTRSSAAGT
jgi:hypothetical protein